MTELHSGCTGYKLMMDRLIQILLAKLFLWCVDTTAHEGCFKNRIDFVKGKPIFYFVFITFKYGSYITLIEFNHFPVNPAVVFFGQVKRCLIVG
ncbi:hypothetical protein D3C76_1353100 [compost metagenome]